MLLPASQVVATRFTHYLITASSWEWSYNQICSEALQHVASAINLERLTAAESMVSAGREDWSTDSRNRFLG